MFSLLMCPCCSSNVMLSDKRSRMGFAHCLEIFCNICDWRKSFYTSKTCDTKNSLSHGCCNIYEPNLQTVIGFRENGKGLSGIEAFARCMNMFSLANNSFENLQSQLNLPKHMNQLLKCP